MEISEKNTSVYISRWAIHEKGFYEKNWKPFCEKLYKKNSFSSLWQITWLAKNYDLDVFANRDGPERLPDDIKVRESIFKKS